MVEIPVGQSVAPDLDFAKVEIFIVSQKKKDFARSYFRQLDIRHFSQYVNFYKARFGCNKTNFRK